MPAGVSWFRYLSFFTAATLTMLAGAQTVHIYYKPLSDLDKYIEEEMKKRRI
ncbi:ubiquinol-cytochrome-c reductase complex assembly factor 6 [Zophobas morio]|uniref:ubiquinol-cytochrome-c reductase complex assembly factor 6 n=1 Tax=Zophobas morio TaxID=2755281 RepID=UPI003082E297